MESFALENGLVQTIMVKDDAGDLARVFIDGYITTSKDVENLVVGCKIEATGLASYDDTFNAPEGPFPRIRVRNRADVVCTENPSVPVELPFVDVADDAWYKEYVEYVYSHGLMNGMSATKFGPKENLRRADLVTIIYRMAGAPAVEGTSSFNDLLAGSYYEDAVIWAEQNNIVNGIKAGLFDPNKYVSRQELVAIIARYARFKGIDTKVEVNLSAFTDANTVEPYAVADMAWAVSTGIIQGMNNGKIEPFTTAERAHAAKIITVLDKLLAD